MNSDQLTYSKLFALLASLGFEEKEADEKTASNQPRVFVHDQTDAILLFRNDARGAVTPADLLSAEVHLHGKGIVTQSLESLLRGVLVEH